MTCLRERIGLHGDDGFLIAEIAPRLDRDALSASRPLYGAHERGRLTVEVDALLKLASVTVEEDCPVVPPDGISVSRNLNDDLHSLSPLSGLKVGLSDPEDLGKTRQMLSRDPASACRPAGDCAPVHMQLFCHPDLGAPLLAKDASERRFRSRGCLLRLDRTAGPSQRARILATFVANAPNADKSNAQELLRRGRAPSRIRVPRRRRM